MEEFKIGDSVKCIKEYDGNKSVVGLVGKVVGIEEFPQENSTQYVSVEYPTRIHRGHSGLSGCGAEGYCWCMPNEYLERANSYAVEIL